AAKPYAKAAYRINRPQDIGIGIARAIRAAVSGRPGGVYLDLPAKLLGMAIELETAKKSLVKVIDPSPRQIPDPASIARALDVLATAQRPLVILGKGAAYAQADEEIRSFIEATGIPFSAHVDGKGPATRRSCTVRRRGALLRNRTHRCGHADRSPPQLAALARQGPALAGNDPLFTSRHLAHRDGQ